MLLVKTTGLKSSCVMGYLSHTVILLLILVVIMSTPEDRSFERDFKLGSITDKHAKRS